MSANVRLDQLSDIVKHRGNLRVWCQCKHQAVVDAAKMLRWYQCHQWDTRIFAIGRHLYCTRCRGRPRDWRATAELPTAPDRFPRTEAEWAALVRGLRNW